MQIATDEPIDQESQFITEFYVFNKVCTASEEAMKKIYNSFLENNNSDFTHMAPLFCKQFLLSNKLEEFELIYKKYKITKLPVGDIISDDLFNLKVGIASI